MCQHHSALARYAGAVSTRSVAVVKPFRSAATRDGRQAPQASRISRRDGVWTATAQAAHVVREQWTSVLDNQAR